MIVEDGDIFGDGVNVAARLQELAEPGGICVSGAVAIRSATGSTSAFEDLGEQSVKNIARPIRVFRVAARRRTPAGAPAPRAGRPRHDGRPTSRRSRCCRSLNMSGDPEQEFFADGLTEDIITELSRFRDLFVISRNSAFVYKGKAVKIQDVAREFGVAVRGRRQRAQGGQPGARHRAADRCRDPTGTSGPSATTASSRTSSRSRTR